MGKIFEKIKNYELYCGLTKEQYDLVKEDITNSAIGSLKLFSVFGSISMAVLFVFTFFASHLAVNRLLYLALFIGCIGVTLGSFLAAKKNRIFTIILVHLFCCLLYAYGIIMGVIISPNDLTVSYVVLLFAIPLVFTDKTLRLTFFEILSIIIYIIAARYTQTDEIYIANIYDIIPYGILNIFVCAYFTSIKVKRVYLERQNKIISETDELTGLSNRHCYENKLFELQKENIPVTVLSIDINGLKSTNDSLGHKAGDELIVQTALLMKEEFSRIGNVYRIGGDEFMIIIPSNDLFVDEMVDNLKNKLANYKGEYVNNISISIGIVSGVSKDIHNLLVEADKLMYQDKSRYYNTRK